MLCTAIFTVITVNTPPGFLTIIGASYFFTALINILHIFTFKEMNIFHAAAGLNLSFKLWSALKLFDCTVMFAAVFFIKKNFKIKNVFIIYSFITFALLSSIFFYKIYPDCFIENREFTFFIIAIEYSGIVLLSAGLYLFSLYKNNFSNEIYSLVVLSFISKIISIFMFVFYNEIHFLLNAGSYFFLFLSFYFIFKASVEINLNTPYKSIFFELCQNNESLLKEIHEKKEAEEKYAESRCRLRSLFDNTQNPMLFHKAVMNEKNEIIDSLIIELNPAFETAFGVKKEEIINRGLRSALPGFANEEFDLTSIIGLCVSGGEDTQLEYYSNNFKKWFLISVFRTSEGHAASIFNDISGQKRIEDMLSESQRFFKSTFNSLTNAVAIINETGMLISANKSWRHFSKLEAFFGNPCGVGDNFIELCGAPAVRATHTDSSMTAAYEIKQNIIKVINNELNEIFSEYRERINDENKYLRATIKKLEGYGPVMLLIIYEDITSQKKSEAILERLNQTFLNLNFDSDNNIKLLTEICGELLETTAIYNKISNGIITAAVTYNAPQNFKISDKAEGHICTDVAARNDKNHGIRYIKDLDKSKYFITDPNVKLYNLKTYLGKPVFCNGECIGTLCVVYDRIIESDAENNKILEIIATAIGIEEERKTSNDRLRQMSQAIEQSASTIVITDIKGNIEYANPKFSQTTGYTLEEAKGQNPRILKSGEMSADEYKKMWNKISNGEDWRGEFHNKRKNGELYWEYATISPLKNLKGEITHYLAVKEDITLRKKIEMELAAAKSSAEAANRSKSEFLANMSHEIRTPMTGVMGMTELLLDTPLNDIQKKYLQHIHESANLLLTIINDILDFSKIEAGKMVIENIDMDLFSILSSVNEMIGIKALEKNLNLTTNIDEKIPAHLKGDPIRIRQILLNLLGNAVKFTGQGVITLGAQLRELHSDKAIVKFEVSDTGTGLSKPAMENLFMPFVQADSSTTRKYGGTGLGLSISKRLVEMMNGEIGVISSEGKGSTFWFELPLELSSRKHSQASSTIKSVSETIEKSVNAPEKINFENITLLLADDSPSNQKVLMLQLNKLGFKNIHVASDGREAVEFCSKNNYSLILMDCQMNVMDGFEASRIIRAKESGQNFRTPIIALTADAMSGTRDKCIAAGMDDYITKPAGMQRLQNIINRWILKR